jgi:hypothetical protein
MVASATVDQKVIAVGVKLSDRERQTLYRHAQSSTYQNTFTFITSQHSSAVTHYDGTTNIKHTELLTCPRSCTMIHGYEINKYQDQLRPI